MLSVEKYIRFNLTVSNIEKALQKYKNSNLAEYNLRSTHMLCLVSLKYGEAMTAADLADVCAVNKALISRVTADLFDMGYIEYTADSINKKYKKKITLTESGLNVTDEIAEKITSAVTSVSGQISETRLAVFYDVLFTIEKNLTNLAKND